jgi:hypothetical protein
VMFKNWRNRLGMAAIFTAFFILVDEYLKEGYIFDYNDILTAPPTHEQLFIVFLIIGLALGLRRWA